MNKDLLEQACILEESSNDLKDEALRLRHEWLEGFGWDTEAPRYGGNYFYMKGDKCANCTEQAIEIELTLFQKQLAGDE